MKTKILKVKITFLEPVLYDYQIKGFFKDSCGMLARVGGKASQWR